jgi:hypothetical protein
MTVVMGVVPMVFLKPMEPSIARVVEQVRRHQGQTAARPAAPSSPAASR